MCTGKSPVGWNGWRPTETEGLAPSPQREGHGLGLVSIRVWVGKAEDARLLPPRAGGPSRSRGHPLGREASAGSRERQRRALTRMGLRGPRKDSLQQKCPS